MTLNWHDYNYADAILALILLTSMLLGIVRGLVREVFSLVAWLMATLIAYLFGPKLAVLLAHWIHEPALRLTFGMAILFVATLLVGALVIHVLSEIVEVTGLTYADHVLGSLFGLARGVIIIMALTVYLPASIKHAVAWQQSRLAPQFEAWEKLSRHSVQQAVDAVHRLAS